MNRRTFLQSTMLAGASYLVPSALWAQQELAQIGTPKSIGIRTQAGTPFPHVWEECAGSDRAVVGLREQWLKDLEAVKKAAGIKSIRFHGLFNDEMGVLPAGAKQPNFLYVDMVYDAMLDRGLKPFVELSFMPGALASGTRSLLWYRGNTTPPKDIAQWGELVGALAKHCVDRYGIGRVSEWDFEVWNEPNIMFWSGTQADYFELYRQSATAIKQVDKRLRVGGASDDRGRLREVESQTSGSCTVARNRQDHRIPQAQRNRRSGGVMPFPHWQHRECCPLSSGSKSCSSTTTIDDQCVAWEYRSNEAGAPGLIKAMQEVSFGWPFALHEAIMPKGPFLPNEFVPTRFSTSAEKANFGNTLLHFLDANCARELFTKKFYNRLSMTFGHIAHYVECVIMRSVDAKTA